MKDIQVTMKFKPVSVTTKTKDQFIQKVRGSNLAWSSGCGQGIDYTGYTEFMNRDIKKIRVYRCWRENKGWNGFYLDLPLDSALFSKIKQVGNTFVIEQK